MCTDGKTIEESPLYNPAQPYENRDPRLLKSIVCIGYPYLGMTITKENVATTGFGVKKYTSYEDDVTIPLVERSAFNFILIRYAEVLLTCAEAQNEANGPDQSVYDAINQLRKRPDINMPEVPKGLTKDQMRNVVRRELRYPRLNIENYLTIVFICLTKEVTIIIKQLIFSQVHHLLSCFSRLNPARIIQ